MQRTEYTSANRRAWNEAAPVLDKNRPVQVYTGTHQSSHNSLSSVSTQIFKQIGLEGKSVAHLCCNNGRELLSIKALGAERCVGFDISDKFIEQAKLSTAASDLDCEFIRTDVYDIPAMYDEDFDIVFISVGTLGWMPDIKAFFQIAARLLKPSGWIVIHEMHPILDMFESDDTNDPPMPQHSYFRSNPYVEDNGLDYYGVNVYKSSPSYWFHHKTSDILDACLASSLTLRSYQEYERDISNVFSRFEQMEVQLPLSYSLVAQKA